MRTFFLDIPFEARSMRPKGATYSKTLKTYVYQGDELPEELKPFQSQDYTLMRWKEDSYNRKVLPVQPSAHKFTPRPHQKEAAVAIAKAAQKGYRGFIEGDGTGIGKTLSSIYGIYGAKKVLKQRSVKVLIVCPKAAINQWVDTLKAFPLPGARICIVNYEQAAKLLKPPATAKNVKQAKTKKAHQMKSGTPTVIWDYIVADESQKLKNWEQAARAKAFGRIARYQDAKDFPFVIWASATIGQNPLELQYVFPLLKQLTKARHSMGWFEWLTKYNFNVKQAKKSKNLSWVMPPKDASPADIAANERLRQADLNRLNKLLFSPQSPSIRRTPVDIAGWPEIQRIAQGSTLTPLQYLDYQKEWLSFRSERKLLLRGKNPKGALAKQLRFRQKSSYLRIDQSVDHIDDLLESGFQVAVYCEFMDSVDSIREKLEKKNYKVAEFTGRNEGVREQERIAFQKGQRNVIIFSVDSAVSFHSEETLADGKSATKTPRATVIHDLPYSGIKATQIEGRCHRDGQSAPVYYMYAMNTTENKIAHRMVERIKNISNIMDDEEFADQLSGLLAGDS